MSNPAVFTIYLVIINGICFMLFAIDKTKAKHVKNRISEQALFSFVLLGGSLGAYLSMKLFHHKTRKPLFRIGIPLIIFIQIMIVVYLKMYLS